MKNTELNKKSMKKPDAFDCVFRDDDDSRKSGKNFFCQGFRTQFSRRVHVLND